MTWVGCGWDDMEGGCCWGDRDGGYFAPPPTLVIPGVVPPKKRCHPERSTTPKKRCHPGRSAPLKSAVIPTEAQRNGGIYRSWVLLWKPEDPSTSLRSGRDDMGAGAGGMTWRGCGRGDMGDCGGLDITVCHTGRSAPKKRCHPERSTPLKSAVIPTEAQRNGGILAVGASLKAGRSLHFASLRSG